MLPSSRIVDARAIYRGWLSLFLVRLQLADEVVIDRHVIVNSRAACVLPYDPIRKVALVVSMVRAPVAYVGESPMLEAIAGALDDSDPSDCARREAWEEAGVELRELDHLGQIWSMPSNSTERIDYYLGAYSAADRTGQGGGVAEENEQIRVHELPLSDLWRQFEKHELLDGKLLTLVLALRIRRPDLFA